MTRPGVEPSFRTRFAPSPTGFLHIGGVRTALFNWLLARHHGGQFILRIDDTDQQRHVEDAVARILDGFRWIGIDWDEGPEVGGGFGPYYQSQRAEIYRRAADRLVASGHVYRDYSTEKERPPRKRPWPTGRSGPIAFAGSPSPTRMPPGSRPRGTPYALRFQVPPGRTLVLHDLIKGDVEFSTDEIGDFVIVRPDGTPLYNFASAVDDVEMQITHVVRAEEHLSNTFPQLLVFEALGARLPSFGHLPYVAEPGSRSKMSKRKIAEYEKSGSWSICISTSRRAISPRPSSIISPDWAGASTAPRRSSAATSFSRSSRSSGSPALPPATTRINCSGSRGSG